MFIEEAQLDFRCAGSPQRNIRPTATIWCHPQRIPLGRVAPRTPHPMTVPAGHYPCEVHDREFVHIEINDRVATLRIDRAPMNALSLRVQSEIAAAAQEIAGRSEIAAVVVYGGPKIFAAGADVKEMAAMDYQEMIHRAAGLQEAFSAVAAIPQPTIAAITGYALGGGLELALCCDLRIAGDNAKVGQPEILLGIIPGAGGTQRLPRLIGSARAKDLIFTGRFVDAPEALAMGIVDRVVAPDDVYSESLTWASRIAAGPPLALRAAKSVIDAGLGTDLATGLQLERLAFMSLFATDDRRIGMNAFVEHGPGHAEFTGR